MSSASVVGFKKNSGAPTLYVYVHGLDSEKIFGEMRDAVIEAAPRWDDEAYATRIAVSHLTRHAKGLTGFGLSIDEFDSPKAGGVVWVVDWEASRVELYSGPQHGYLEFMASLSFADLSRGVTLYEEASL